MTTRVGSAIATLAALAVLSGCGSETPHATDPAAPTSGSSVSTATTPPEFTATDYSFRLESICFCPMVGPVDIEIRDGKVASATILRGPDRGRPAPAYLRLTIPTLIERASDPSADKIEVDWPDDQAWPNRIEIDHMKLAVDDEITYVIKSVQIAS